VNENEGFEACNSLVKDGYAGMNAPVMIIIENKEKTQY